MLTFAEPVLVLVVLTDWGCHFTDEMTQQVRQLFTMAH